MELLPQYDPEGGSFIYFRRFYLQLSLMIRLDDALTEGKTQSPAPFFCAEAGFKDLVEVVFGNALAGIRNVDPGFRRMAGEVDRDPSLSFESVQGIFKQVLHDPVEQEGRDHGRHLFLAMGLYLEFYPLWRSFTDIFHHTADLL